ncbi:glycosyl transferase [Methanobrevibacter arboriphilus]|jgi:N-acetyl-alpha-D-glucosaminyl L-malate synthase BshA|uniref:Glycosyl transferase n=1 Tax=Methanobrevibacter arboriphilus TaxID=39441 RepID=A0ACA8R5C5_METAZ|nr:glycosyltransferase family 4 protein [Methanobrevibacter arboriphilus]BBL62862.1 glycosyl transferase [Methanobrevibacter arboriphilus]GLI12551.1 glycosyl transferase [Methanobrevibacter arboriphilus]
MKIAMVGQFPPHIGGVGVHINSLSKELLKNGEEVFVITYPHKDIKNEVNKDYMDNNGIKVIGTRGINIPGLRSLFYVLFGTINLIRIVRKYNIDIIHGHYLYPAGLIAVLGGMFTKKKVYVTSHGSDMFCLYPQHKFMRPIIRFVLKRADVVLAVSESLKEEILKTNIPNIERKVRLNWNTVDINEFKIANNDSDHHSKNNSNYNFKNELNIPKDKPIILFVGNIIKRKNVATIIDAKKQLKSGCVLVVVGDGPLLNSLKEKVKVENVEDVIFTGARNDIANVIQSSDLLILPSYSESFGLVLIEALACGKPVIGSNVGGIKEIITDDVGLLVEPTDSKGLANSIDLILSDKKLREKFQSNARDRAMDFSEVDIPYY